MTRTTNIALIILIFTILSGCMENKRTILEDTTESHYQVGQTWYYRTRPGDEGSTFTVLKVETHPELGVIVHITVQGIRIKNPQVPNGFSGGISHMPFAEEAIDNSVLNMVSEANPLPDYQEGYEEWRTAFENGSAGIFSITVAEAVDVMENALNQ